MLRALSRVTTQLREKLGESLSSIQRFDKPLEGPLEQATTSKLEAFKAWSVAIEHSYSGRPMEAIPFYKRAVELDPNFAHAYACCLRCIRAVVGLDWPLSMRKRDMP